MLTVLFSSWLKHWIMFSVCDLRTDSPPFALLNHIPLLITVIWLSVWDTEKAGSAQPLCQKARKEGPLLDSSSRSNEDQMGQAELSRPFPVCARFAHSWSDSDLFWFFLSCVHFEVSKRPICLYIKNKWQSWSLWSQTGSPDNPHFVCINSRDNTNLVLVSLISVWTIPPSLLFFGTA